MAKNFKTLEAKMSRASLRRSSLKAQAYAAALPLDELREARSLTQEHLGRLLGVQQASISKLERRTDMYLSTMQAFVKALGGRLQLLAVFPEGSVEINQFYGLRKGSKNARRRSLTKISA